MIAALYCVIILISTLLGALVGLGGGVIIKPMLDLVGQDPVDVVGFISAVAVFSMSIAATIKYLHAKTPVDKRVVLLIAAGAAAGGYLGNVLFEFILSRSDSQLVKGVQGLILGCILIGVNLYIGRTHKKSLHLHNPAAVIAVGFFLGMIASFLGIGGGPINVAFLVFFFSFSMKEAAVYSVATIFFSQLTKLATIYAGNRFEPYDLTMLLYIIPVAVLGGIIGARLNQKCSDKTLRYIFTAAVYGVALVNFYNAFTGLFL